MFGNCKIHADISIQLKEGERGKPIIYCPKCEEERLSRFEKMFGESKLPDVVRVEIKSIPTHEIKENDGFHKYKIDQGLKSILDFHAAIMKMEHKP